MIQFLIRHFVPDHEQTQQPQVRQRYGVLAAVVGILSNIFLFLIKALVGLLFHSISSLPMRSTTFPTPAPR